MKPIRDVLYLTAQPDDEQLATELQEAGGQPIAGGWVVLQREEKTVRLLPAPTVERAMALLSDHYFNFVVVDARRRGGEDGERVSTARRFIERIHYAADPDQRYPLSRMIVVLDDDEQVAQRSFELGKLRVGGFVVEPFGGSLFDIMERLYDPDPGKTAICMSGGGVEGFLFELGVLMALNAHLQTEAVTDFDIYCGISAGSILAAFLANRTQPEEIADAMTNREGAGSMDGLSPGVIYDPAFKEYLSRIWSLGRSMPIRSGSDLISSMLKSVPTGFFRGQALHRFVERQLTNDGRKNDFRRLSRELYIGATEQDTSTHVVFGDGQWRDIPISLAVRASTALTPFFPPAKIRGRYFVDGQYTRTSNFHVAVERGAKLVIIVDPLVPIRVEVPGYVRRKGGVFGGLQALKALIHTRFMHGFQAAVDNYPEVDFVLFKPEGEIIRLMSGSPMKYNIRSEIINMAYRYAVQRIQRDYEVLMGTFARHHLRLQREPRLRGAYHEFR